MALVDLSSKTYRFNMCGHLEILIYHVLLVEPPSFVRKLENLSSLVGTDVSLQCTLKGSEPITVSWLKDNHELKEAENVHISYENKTAQLHINGLQSEHGGKYSCHAQNQAGSQTCSAVLTVKGWLNIFKIWFVLSFIYEKNNLQDVFWLQPIALQLT